MSRRRRVFLAFAILVVMVLGVFVITVFTATRTGWGRSKVRNFIASTLNGRVQGRVYLGTLGGNLFNSLTLDSLEIRDRNDSLFIALGRLEVEYDPRDLLDRRILLHKVRLATLAAQIFEDSVGMFNFRRLFPSGPPGPPVPQPRRAWGQFIKVEDVVVDSATITLSTRWHPDERLTRVQRDSVIAFNLARQDKEIRRGPGSFYETKRWTRGHIELDSARIDDRQQGGRHFAIRHLTVDESDPPFRFRNARGMVRIQGDSIWADVPQFELPASAANMTGKVWWGNGQPTHFDLTIKADKVAMADIAWVYPTLPTTGTGKMDLVIRSEEDPRIIDYVLTNMDVRSTDSRLRGDMTFGIGAPVTIVKDVDLSAEPLDFKLIETLAGEPLPYPWRGTITGTLQAAGGPLNDWQVDASDMVFRDANVPGAITIGQAKGKMNILQPSEVVFNGLDVHLDQMDLRTLQFLVPTFPRLNGNVAGNATLDSLWTDVRFRNADLTHSDGSGPATRMLGAGRVTFGETFTSYDVAMTAQPFSFTTFSRAYTETRIPLKGEYVGPVRLQGTTSDLVVTTDLSGPAGRLAYDGRVDGDSIGGYGLDGVLTVRQLDLRTLLDTAITPMTDLSGRATMAVTFDSLFNLKGTAEVDFDRSRIDSVVVYEESRARMRFADGRLSVIGTDTLLSPAGQLLVSGGLGLGAPVRDSLLLEYRLDSLGGWRHFLGSVAAADSLAGTLTASLTLTGSVDTLGVGGWLDGRDLLMPGMTVRHLRVVPALTDVARALGGRVNVMADTADLGGVRFSSIGGDVSLVEGKAGTYSALATESTGPVIQSGGGIQVAGDTTIVRVDSLSVMMDAHRFRLQRPADVRVEPQRLVVDTLVLEGNGDERLVFAANAPRDLPMSAVLEARSLDLDDLSQALQTKVAMGGQLTALLQVTGTRDEPEMKGTATLNSVTAGDVRVARISMEGTYADRRLRAQGRVTQADTTVLTAEANIPIDLALATRDTRLLRDTMRVTVRSPAVDLGLLESFTTAVRNAGGVFTANLDLVGPSDRARLNGSLTVTDGRSTLPGMGITLRDVFARVQARNDTVLVDSLFMLSGPERNNFLTAGGWVAHPLSPDSVAFDLRMRARDFHAIGLERELADLYISSDLTWRGTDDASQAGGNVTVQRGTIALPESSDKDLFSIENWRELGIDSTTVGRLGLLPARASRFLAGLSAENVRVVMGPDVWLRSEDADIKLTGAVNLTVSRATTISEDQLALTGDLQTERGTYRLNVSPLQRTFLVESGRLRFNGDPGFNPDLDIRAVYTSRTINSTYGGRNDVRIGARITGTLVSPSIELYSADSLLGLSQSDLVSYVLIDQPSFSVGGGLRGNTNTAVSILLGTLSSFASSAASQYAGGLVDYVQLQTTSERALFGANTGLGGALGGAFEGAQLGVGKQWSDRLFVSATSGLCQVGQLFQSSSSGAPSLLSSIGAKVEYRFGRTSPSGLSASYEPSFDKLVCTGGDRGFTTSKKQVGFDLFRVWRR